MTGYSGVWSISHRSDINSWCVECATEIPASVCHRDTCYWCVECLPQRYLLLVCGVPQRYLLLVCGVLATEIPATGVWSVPQRYLLLVCGMSATEIPATGVWSVCHRDTCYWCVECQPQS